jgi:hypothetical protein
MLRYHARNHELDPLNLLTRVTIQHGHIARSEALHLSLPAWVGHFDTQHSAGKI